MARELVDRRDRLFGREGDLAALIKRARYKGLTAVVARPQMGKSWLLTELARRLAQQPGAPHVVGFAESFGETPDLLLRTVVDLYARWLSDAGLWQQARKVWQNQKANLLPSFAKTLGKIFKEVADPLTKPGAVVVEEAINSLVAADERLRTGTLKLPTLSYEQARDLVASVAEISGRPIALFLDQWEKSPDTALESKTLDSFLAHLDDWPACHIFMALRPDEPAHGEVERLAKSLPGTAETYPLQEMNLGTDESHRLTAFVRDVIPAAADQSDQDLLKLIDGYPGVLYQWTRDYQREHMHTLADLHKVAEDATNNRFSDLNALLPDLEGNRRRLAIRFALLAPSDQTWPVLRHELLGDLPEDLIDDLALDKLLESRDPPGFGHAKRWEAARDWLLENRRAGARYEAEDLISRLAGPVGAIDLATEPYAAALRSLLPWTVKLGARDVFVAACQAATTLFGDHSAADDTLLLGARAARSAAFDSVVPLLAMGLNNVLHGAKWELARRDALLLELRELAKAYPEEARTRDSLAIALFNTLNDAKAEDDLVRRDALLDELRALAGQHPEEMALHEWLANSLLNTMSYAKAEDDLARRDALLDELRALAGQHSECVEVRENLAKGLHNTLIDAKAEDDLARRDALLEELRTLATAYPEHAAMYDILATALFNTLNAAKLEDDLVRRDALLEELRALATAYPEHAAMYDILAKGLLNTLIDAKEEDDLARRDALLEELRRLAKTHPEDSPARECLARALADTLIDANTEDDLVRRDALLDELRALAGPHPEDVALRECLARALADTLIDANTEDDLVRRDALLDELRALAGPHPEDLALREWLANSLLNTLNYAKAEDDLVRRDALLDELRALAGQHSECVEVRENLAKGLRNTLIDAKAQDDLARRDALLDELRALARAHPNDAATRDKLAWGLAKTMLDATDEGPPERWKELLEELKLLAEANPEDDWVEQVRSAGLLEATDEGPPERWKELLEELRSRAKAHAKDN